MATHQQIADFVERHVAIGRVRPGADYRLLPYYGIPDFGGPLPKVEEVGESLFQSAEFNALLLGGLLNSPTGQFLEQAVELVVPRALAPEFDLIVAALRYASDRQQGASRAKAVFALGGTLLFGFILRELSKAV
jgi:hypothetical protein